jgi:hypothetical protein
MYQWGSLACCLREDRYDRQILTDALLLYKQVIIDLRRTPPFGLFLDLLALLEQGESFASRAIDKEDGGIQQALRRQRQELLWRFVRSPRFLRLHRLFLQCSTTPPPSTPLDLGQALSLRQQAAVFLLVEWFHHAEDLLIEPFRPHALSSFAPPHEPPIWWTEPAQALRFLDSSLDEPNWSLRQYEAICDTLSQLSDDTLFPDELALLLQHLEDLPIKLDRLRWRSLAAALLSIPKPADPLHLLHLRDQGYAQMLLPSSSLIPEGGIHGITRRGALESLLPSEMVFWDADPQIDLFSLRWLEHEMLFFEREQQHRYTRHRRLSLLLDLEIGDLAYKAPHAQQPLYALLGGFLGRLFQDLRSFCSEEVLSFHIFILDAPKWKAESALWELFFQSLEGIGSLCHLTLLPSIEEYLLENPPKIGDTYLLLTSPLRAAAYRRAKIILPHHALICFAPLPEPNLPTMPIFSLEAESAFLPLHPLRPMASLFALWEYPDIPQALAKMRDLLLASILQLPPRQAVAASSEGGAFALQKGSVTP